jgi:hypothetical protein
MDDMLGNDVPVFVDFLDGKGTVRPCPENDLDIKVMVTCWLKNAPEMQGWEFGIGTPRVPSCKIIKSDEHEVDLSEMMIYASVDNERKVIDVIVDHPIFRDINPGDKGRITFRDDLLSLLKTLVTIKGGAEMFAHRKENPSWLREKMMDIAMTSWKSSGKKKKERGKKLLKVLTRKLDQKDPVDDYAAKKKLLGLKERTIITNVIALSEERFHRDSLERITTELKQEWEEIARHQNNMVKEELIDYLTGIPAVWQYPDTKVMRFDICDILHDMATRYLKKTRMVSLNKIGAKALDALKRKEFKCVDRLEFQGRDMSFPGFAW